MSEPLKKYWAWNYEMRQLGSFPTENYTGHNQAVEVYKAADVEARLAVVTQERDEHKRWREKLADDLHDRESQLAASEAKYHDLITQVGKKFPDESRHDTAKRYLHDHENRCGSGGPVEAAAEAIIKAVVLAVLDCRAKAKENSK